MTVDSQRVVVFLKAPRAGFVKTRLAETLGAEAACAAYRQLAETLLTNLAAWPNAELCFTPADAEPELRPWLRPDWTCRPQSDGDLGARLQAAFAAHFAAKAERVVVLGADCPDVNISDLEAAFASLDAHDVVLGPALDGGYWLIGLRAPQPTLFAHMPWSTDRVFGETMRRAREANLRVATLRELADVDTAADWERWCARLRTA